MRNGSGAVKRATSRAGMRTSIAALATALALAFGAGPLVADNLHPYLVGHWNDSGYFFPGFKLRIINPTSENLLAVVAVFDHDELPFACARVVLTPNDEAMLASQAPVWLPYGFPFPETPSQNVPVPLMDVAVPIGTSFGTEFYPFDAFEGVIKVVSLYAETEEPALEERVKDGLLAWIMNASNVNLQLFGELLIGTEFEFGTFLFGTDFPPLPSHQSFGSEFSPLADFMPWSFPYNVRLHGVPERFLRARSNAELNLIAGDEACGSDGVTTDFFPAPPFDSGEPFDFFFPFTFDSFGPI